MRPSVPPLLALFGRPASNILMLLVFLLGLMFFFAITPADVVLFVNSLYQKFQQAQASRAEAETAYDTRLFNAEPEEETVENLTGGATRYRKPPAPPCVRCHCGHQPLPEAAGRAHPAAAGAAGGLCAPVTPVVPQTPLRPSLPPAARRV